MVNLQQDETLYFKQLMIRVFKNNEYELLAYKI
jgi:hypothetical protein